jgi:virginiamycin B lyase
MRARLLTIAIVCTFIAACGGAGSIAQSGRSVNPAGIAQPRGIQTRDGSTFQIFPLRAKAFPGSVAVGPRNKVWFTDTDPVHGVSKIGRITMDGHAEEFALQSGSDPADIVQGPDGNMWFTEYHGDRVGRITPSGTISEFSPPSSGLPLHIAVGPDGNIWFTEPASQEVGRITTTGQITEYPVYGVGITAGPDGNLWLTGGHGAIERMNTSGVVTATFKTHNDAQPQDIITGPDGKLYFAQWRPSTGYAIGRMTTAGVLKEYPLAGQIVNGLTPAYGSVWFAVMGSSGSGLGNISPQGVITQNLLQSTDVLDVVLGPDGNLWFSYGSSIGVFTP